MKIVAIAGGSGSGKSTLAYKLIDAYPETFEVLNFDDYQKIGTDKNLPTLHGMTNWDHPDIIRWDMLREDAQALKDGHTVTIQTWSHRSNPDYRKTKKMLPRTIYPKPVLLVEGYMALYDKTLRDMYDMSIYLDISLDESKKRRDKDVLVDREYAEKVLKPMHAKYVIPTKACADSVLDVSSLGVDEVFEEVPKAFNLAGIL